MLRKIFRAILGKEEYELKVSIEIGIIDFIFILSFLIAFIWMITAL